MEKKHIDDVSLCVDEKISSVCIVSVNVTLAPEVCVHRKQEHQHEQDQEQKRLTGWLAD